MGCRQRPLPATEHAATDSLRLPRRDQQEHALAAAPGLSQCARCERLLAVIVKAWSRGRAAGLGSGAADGDAVGEFGGEGRDEGGSSCAVSGTGEPGGVVNLTFDGGPGRRVGDADAHARAGRL